MVRFWQGSAGPAEAHAPRQESLLCPSQTPAMGLFFLCIIFFKNVYNINMINYYEKSKKEFIKYIKKNPYVTREEWDEYAHQNCLFSALTLCSHEITENTLEILQKHTKPHLQKKL